MPAIYVLNVPEFKSLVDVAEAQPGWRVTAVAGDYYRIESASDLVFHRKELKMKPAVWYGCLTGGVRGKVVQFDRDNVRISAE